VIDAIHYVIIGDDVTILIDNKTSAGLFPPLRLLGLVAAPGAAEKAPEQI
jgi:hypothetical protein